MKEIRNTSRTVEITHPSMPGVLVQWNQSGPVEGQLRHHDLFFGGSNDVWDGWRVFSTTIRDGFELKHFTNWDVAM